MSIKRASPPIPTQQPPPPPLISIRPKRRVVVNSSSSSSSSSSISNNKSINNNNNNNNNRNISNGSSNGNSSSGSTSSTSGVDKQYEFDAPQYYDFSVEQPSAIDYFETQTNNSMPRCSLLLSGPLTPSIFSSSSSNHYINSNSNSNGSSSTTRPLFQVYDHYYDFYNDERLEAEFNKWFSNHLSIEPDRTNNNNNKDHVDTSSSSSSDQKPSSTNTLSTKVSTIPTFKKQLKKVPVLPSSSSSSSSTSSSILSLQAGGGSRKPPIAANLPSSRAAPPPMVPIISKPLMDQESQKENYTHININININSSKNNNNNNIHSTTTAAKPTKKKSSSITPTQQQQQQQHQHQPTVGKRNALKDKNTNIINNAINCIKKVDVSINTTISSSSSSVPKLSTSSSSSSTKPFLQRKLELDDEVKELLANHNKKFYKKTYEPRMHSTRDVKDWEAFSGQTWYSLSIEEREMANKWITDRKNNNNNNNNTMNNNQSGSTTTTPPPTTITVVSKDLIPKLKRLKRKRYIVKKEFDNDQNLDGVESLKDLLFSDTDLTTDDIIAVYNKSLQFIDKCAYFDYDLSAFESNIKDTDFTDIQQECFIKFWKIHETNFKKTRFNNTLQKMSWRIDLKTKSKDVPEMNEPTSIIEFNLSSNLKNDNKTIRFEMDRDQLHDTLEQINNIQKHLKLTTSTAAATTSS
ncbi:hypothetical protein DFA_03810 [Cavenderia fasciculata]|uniref:COMM domain-containing protein 1 n=1 Tax=Cavenderia fasciculata TaxID=261658 RepID=F4Q0G5_CACFS|nr:uncharacterized protein DFA_03810 [Cavenderia fasciculata]EGG18316.1 hypothetical protein DFA_03810 [Cavenderia fasciculata]|eukprot:XP_004357139.1 hypothetical protein DFA_03810 [Cavenderia fasciculata]